MVSQGLFLMCIGQIAWGKSRTSARCVNNHGWIWTYDLSLWRRQHSPLCHGGHSKAETGQAQKTKQKKKTACLSHQGCRQLWVFFNKRLLFVGGWFLYTLFLRRLGTLAHASYLEAKMALISHCNLEASAHTCGPSGCSCAAGSSIAFIYDLW